jgi:hypothetical protein
MAEEQQVQIPGFLQYRADEALVQMATQTQAALEHLDKEIQTKNHIPTISAQRDQNLPMFKMLTGLATLIHQDVLRYMANVTEYLIDKASGESSLELAVPPELTDEVTNIMGALDDGIEEIKKLIEGKLKKDLQEKLDSILSTMKEDIDDMETRIVDATYEPGEPEPEPAPEAAKADDYEPLL